VLAPTLDDVLLTGLGEAARSDGDDLTWLLTSFLAEDSRRRARWSRALAGEAALGLGTMLEEETGGDVTAAGVAGQAQAARQEFLAGLLD
jgi:methane/phenol/toluene hydroxylase